MPCRKSQERDFDSNRLQWGVSRAGGRNPSREISIQDDATTFNDTFWGQMVRWIDTSFLVF